MAARRTWCLPALMLRVGAVIQRRLKTGLASFWQELLLRTKPR